MNNRSPESHKNFHVCIIPFYFTTQDSKKKKHHSTLHGFFFPISPMNQKQKQENPQTRRRPPIYEDPLQCLLLHNGSMHKNPQHRKSFFFLLINRARSYKACRLYTSRQKVQETPHHS